MASTEINEFLCGPLVTWFISCLEDPNALTNYDDLVDGVLLHNVFLQIDPEPLHDGITPSGGDSKVRVKNLEIIIDNMRQFYEEQLGHLLLTVPDIIKLGRDPERHVSEAKLLLLLLLGCAVQCSNKEDFITKIKMLNIDTQLAIVDCIKQVTDYQEIVVTQESMENVSMGSVFSKVKKLLKERNAYWNKLKSLQLSSNVSGDCDLDRDDRVAGDGSIDDTADDSALLSQNSSISQGRETSTPKKIGLSSSPMSNKLERLFGPSGAGCRDGNVGGSEEAHRYAVELADWKSKVRKQRQELEEKTEALIETREELEHTKALLQKLREENQDLLLEARTAKSYRDELDAAIERAEKADRLEAEVARYREKLTDIEYYKSRIEELREDNRVLLETREMLEEQLNAARRRSEKVLELESELLKCEQRLNDLSLERVAERDRCQELCEKNAQLQRLIRTVAAEATQGAGAATPGSDSESEGPADGTGGRLSEQLSESAQARALKLELENRRLNSLVESLKEQSLHEGSARLLELEKERKRLSLKLDSLSESNERLGQQNRDLEALCKQSLEENGRLQASLATQRSSLDKQQQELQTLQARLPELERAHEAALARERQRFDAAERRAEDAERTLASRERDLEVVKKTKEELSQEVSEIHAELDRERESARAEMQRLREQLESKEVALDEAGNAIEILEKRLAEIQQEVGDSAAQILRLREVERSSRELDERAAIDREALESLQSNLEAEKLSIRRVSTTLERLGLELADVLDLSEDTLLDRLAELPGLAARVLARREGETEHEKTEGEHDGDVRVAALQATSEALLAEKSRLELQVARLEAQSNSLSSQQAVLQLANSRLEADVEEMASEHGALQRAHAELSHDQKRLQSLHEQLASEYESLSGEKEGLKVGLRDAKNESRVLRESAERLESRLKALQAERDSLLANAKSLANLRQEHSKLKEDFRNLYTNTEGLKAQYRALQDDYRKAKLDSNKLSLRQAEMQGELSAKDDQLASLELQLGKLDQRCEMLLQSNSGLDNDRRSLMNHVSLLLNQYHELLTLAFEDKEHYHMEEKMYTDRVNHLHRQKEKLEEKIMEHYRNLESCSSKKKSLGANLVRRVYKAGSGLFNRTGRRASWGTANSNLLCDNGSLNAEDEDVNADEEEEEEEGRVNGRGDEDDNDAGDEDDEEEEVGRTSSTEPGRRGSDDSSAEPSLEAGDALSLAHPGTRRTVYYTDDTSPSLTRTTSQEKRTESDEPTSYQSQTTQSHSEPRPLLIYNKVSAVINDTSTITTTPVSKKSMDDPKNLEKDLLDSSNEKDRKTANSVWYEYGCV
ncbi:protein Daple [Copidosoma floridanum]|uniref:protein Daple n=1 Tax=Copidosoma floridanum TaxID=29053 RepID=UPI0006C9D29B|nr:protein Daple [Copidosoma floridanum]